MKKLTCWCLPAIVIVIMAATSSVVWQRTGVAQESPRRTSQDAKQLQIGERRMHMRQKLSMVQKIVEGLATDDFELLKKGGMELTAIAETAAWKSTSTPFYRDYSANFEHAVRGLIEAADAKSIEKATFAYVHLTISCTACHQHVRGTIRAAK